MKKALVVISLFALPIVAYLFFSSGVNNFAKLPVVKEEVQSLENFSSLRGENISFEDNINILGFFGRDISEFKGYAFNLNQKIYKKYHKFKDFQFVIVVPEGTQEEVRQLLSELDDIVEVHKWKFVFGNENEIISLYESLNAPLGLDNKLATPYVFILDKKGRLRGRKDAEEDVMPHAYNAGSVAELGDKMEDDVKIILAEYRLELKKYNNKGSNAQ